MCILIKWASSNLGRCLLWPSENELSERSVSPRDTAQAGLGWWGVLAPVGLCVGTAAWPAVVVVPRRISWDSASRRLLFPHRVRCRFPTSCISVLMCFRVYKGGMGRVRDRDLSHLSVPNIPSASRPEDECSSGSVKGTPFFLGQLGMLIMNEAFWGQGVYNLVFIL